MIKEPLCHVATWPCFMSQHQILEEQSRSSFSVMSRHGGSSCCDMRSSLGAHILSCRDMVDLHVTT